MGREKCIGNCSEIIKWSKITNKNSIKQLYIKMLCFVVFDFLYTSAFSQSVVMVTNTEHEAWKTTEIKQTSNILANPDIVIDNSKKLQTIERFGSCFNELGWTS
jgi:glucosylceramidase